jgi:hypothetical protein
MRSPVVSEEVAPLGAVAPVVEGTPFIESILPMISSPM